MGSSIPARSFARHMPGKFGAIPRERRSGIREIWRGGDKSGRVTGQRSEVRGQRSEVRSRRSEIRSDAGMSEVRGCEVSQAEVRGWISEARRWMLEARSAAIAEDAEREVESQRPA